MARIYTVPPKLNQEILTLLAEGHPVTKITAMLNEKYTANYSYDAVNRLVVKLRKEYQEIAKAKLVQAVESTTTSDIHILDTVINGLFEKYQEAIQQDNYSKTIAYASELNKWHTKRIELSGINNNDSPQLDNEEAKEEIIEQLKQYTKITQN